MLSTAPAVVISPRCQSVALHAQPSTLRRAACSRCLSCVRGAVCLFPRWSCSTSPVNSTSEVSGVAREQRVQDWTSNAAVARMGWKKESPTSAPWGKLEKAVSQCCSNRGRYWACSDRSVSPGKFILLCKWLPAVPEGYYYLPLSCTMDFYIINLGARKLWFSNPSLVRSQ